MVVPAFRQPVMTDDGEKKGVTAGEPRTSPAPNLEVYRLFFISTQFQPSD